ncbi:MAG: type II toxin-antitoxin system RelE/ParE family toxin [Rickettsiales bacterium]|nr:type II toxin-antitoxin system RelE/ParE family toxin [Rickettsiales bacterium]
MKNKVVYQVLFAKKAVKEFKKLPYDIRVRIDKSINEKLYHMPGQYLVPLSGVLSGLYKFRVGDYRLICKRENEKLIILVLTVRHRREVYE